MQRICTFYLLKWITTPKHIHTSTQLSNRGEITNSLAQQMFPPRGCMQHPSFEPVPEMPVGLREICQAQTRQTCTGCHKTQVSKKPVAADSTCTRVIVNQKAFPHNWQQTFPIASSDSDWIIWNEPQTHAMRSQKRALFTDALCVFKSYETQHATRDAACTFHIFYKSGTR